MEREEIALMTFLGDSANWSGRMKTREVMVNALRLRGLVEKMFVLTPVDHPHYFTELFADPDFVQQLQTVIEVTKMGVPEKIYYCEFSEKMRESLIMEGILNIEAIFHFMPSFMVLPEKVLAISVIPGGVA